MEYRGDEELTRESSTRRKIGSRSRRENTGREYREDEEKSR